MGSPAWSITPADFFLPNVGSSVLMQDFIANEPSRLRVQVPTLIEPGTNDALVPYDGVLSLRSSLCGNGSHPELDAVKGGTHDSAMALSYDHASEWIAARLKGTPDSGNCPPS